MELPRQEGWRNFINYYIAVGSHYKEIMVCIYSSITAEHYRNF
jgi:hypothetical protein